MKNPAISVVVPVYKTEKYINQCVDSILSQTFADFELILVNDGSPDNCPKICDDYALKDARVQVIHKENGGQTTARQAGIAAASGEYVLVFDSDDWLELNALQVMIESAKSNNADIVTFDGYFNYTNHQSPVRQSIKAGSYDKKGLIENVYPKMLYSGRFFYFGIYAAMWNKLFRRELITPNIMNIDKRVRIGEDGLTTFACFLDADLVNVLDEKFLYHYRDNNISITRSYYQNQFENARLLIESLRIMNQSRLDVFDLSTQIDYYFMYNIRSIITEEYYYRVKKSFLAKFRYIKEIVNSDDVNAVASRILLDGLSKEHQLFFERLRSKKVLMIIMAAMKQAYFMRLKVFVRRKIGRY